jgi:hypothetical protein
VKDRSGDFIAKRSPAARTCYSKRSGIDCSIASSVKGT